jgi:Pro-kumamolisin, activation domain/Bacterial Ig-like domain (group 3)
LGLAVKIGTLCRWLTAAYLVFGSLAVAQQSLQTLRGHMRPAVLNGKAAPTGLMAPETRLNLSLVLPLRNEAGLASLLSRIYDPSSPDYRHYLSQTEFTGQFGPAQEDYDAVVSFARASGFAVTGSPANRLVVPISGTVAQVEKAFNVRMGFYHHPTQNRLFFSPDREPSLDLNVPIAHIAGLDNYSLPQPMVTRANASQAAPDAASAGSGPGGSYLASDMRAAYYGGTALTGAGQTVGLLEFDGYDPSDVNLTFSSAGQSTRVPINNVLLDGQTGASVSGDDSEEVVDIVQAIGMAPGLSQVRVYIGSSDVDLLNAVASEDVARQISISWSWSPADPATDDEFFEEFAAQGQSVFAGSGDWGEFDPYFDDFYPAEDAYVTAVGGTDLTTDGAGQAWAAETAWNWSGGGVSPDGIPLPAWQAGVANSTNGGSNSLRNVPDVAAEANTDNYICEMGVCAGDFGGTSFGAPRWAGFMALVNQQAAENGDASVGFLNPAIYSIGEGSGYGDDFHDIVIGNNDARENCCGWPYYNAVPGYDLVTGWGSPDGQSLMDALAPQAPPSFALSSSASALTINPGSSGQATVTVAANPGFTGNVALAVSGLPSGVTTSWSANPVSGKSVLALAVASTAVRGSYLLTVAGTSGAQTQSTSLELTVNAPGFTLVPSPANLKIYPGTSGTVSINFTGLGGFNGSVNLAVTSGLPSGVTASWVNNPTTGVSTLTLTASGSAPANSDAEVTVTGTAGNLTATAMLALVVSPPLFYLNIAPYPMTIVRGGTVTTTVSAVPVDHFSDAITLAAPALPPGVTALFNPATVQFGQTSTLTLTASSSAPTGTGYADIEARGSYSETLNQFTMAVTAAPAPSFTIGVAQSTVALAQGGLAADGITITPQNGFAGSVSLTVTSALPGGVTAAFAPSSTTGGSRLTLSASATATAGFYTLWIAGTSGAQSTVAAIFLSVNPPPGFTLSASSAAVNVTQGAGTAAQVAVIPQTGFNGTVHLAVTSALPAGMTALFAPDSTAGSSTLALNANYSVAAGTYPLTIAGTSGGRTVTTTIPLNVQAVSAMPTAIALTLSPSEGTLVAGSPFTITATVTPAGGENAPTGQVVFTVGDETETTALNSSGVATLAATAPSGTGSLSISAAYQGAPGFAASASATMNESIAAPVPAAFALAATAVTLAPGATTGNTSTITITPSGGFAGAVNLTAQIVSAPLGAKNLPVLSFGPTTPVALNSSAASAILTISTTAGSTTTARSAGGGFGFLRLGGTALACILLIGVPRRRRWRALFGMVALFFVLASGMTACNGSLVASVAGSGAAESTDTTLGTYTISLTGASGATTSTITTATTTVALTVE